VTAPAIPTETPARDAPRIYRPVLRAMGQTGAAALASGLLSALATKIIAAVGGPSALATLATLQQLRQAAVVAATGNGQTALMRGASALRGREQAEYVRTVAGLFAASTALAAGAMVLWPQALAALAGFGPAASRLLPWLAIPMALTSTLVFASALLNALGAIGRLAILSLIAPAAMAVGAWPAAQAFAAGKPRALLALLIFAAALSGAAALLALLGLRSQFEAWLRGPGKWWSGPAAGRACRMSAALLASGLAASGALLAVRGHITATQGLTVTGQFDAAWGLSMNQVTLVLSSLQTYYLPAVARSRHPAERDGHISSVLCVAALAAAGAIAGIAMLKPWLLKTFYSAAFAPAAAYLRWTLLGDYLKVTSWILSIPILAAGDMKMFLAADLAAYGVFVAVSTGLASALAAASGAAIGFVAMYATHLILCAIYLRRKLRVAPARGAVAAWLLGLAVVTAVSALNWGEA
jgi:O-antigen/teichoic acid export membrane protein